VYYACYLAAVFLLLIKCTVIVAVMIHQNPTEVELNCIPRSVSESRESKMTNNRISVFIYTCLFHTAFLISYSVCVHLRISISSSLFRCGRVCVCVRVFMQIFAIRCFCMSCVTWR